MPCFTHTGSTTPISKESGATVHLTEEPSADPDYGVAVFVWERMDCGCNQPMARDGLTHSATLAVEAPISFLCEGVCRGAGAGEEVLYAGLVRVRHLTSVTPNPSGCDG